MPEPANDRLRSILVLLATAATIAFNGLAIGGFVGHATTKEIADRYPMVLTPASYAFSIWSLIYFGLAAFAVFQLLPGNMAVFRRIRTLYIATCLLNIGWLYFWHYDHPAICLAIIVGLAIILIILTSRMMSAEDLAQRLTKATFGLYAGWVTVASFVNLFVVFMASGIAISPQAANLTGGIAIILASVIAVLVVWKLRNYFFPLAVAWGITAIAIKQSGNTAIVVACAITVVVCLVAAVSFVMSLPTMKIAENKNE